MLSVPAKSARRLSSLFTGGSSPRDSRDSPGRPPLQARSPQQSPQRSPKLPPNYPPPPPPAAQQVPPLQSDKSPSLHATRSESAGPEQSPSRPASQRSSRRPESTVRLRALGGSESAVDDLPAPPPLADVNPDISYDPETSLRRPSSRGSDSLPLKPKGRLGKKAAKDARNNRPKYRAWITGAGQDVPYDVAPLLKGEEVCALLN